MPFASGLMNSMRKTEMYRLIEVLESFPGRELRKAIKSALATSLKSRFAFGPRKSKNAEIRYGIGLESGPGDFRLFGFEPLIRIRARRGDRHCVLENLSERGPEVLCALHTLRSHFQSISYPLVACLRSLRRVDLSIKRPSLSRKKACQNFEAGLLWTLAIKWFFGLTRNRSKPGLLTSIFFH